MAFDLFGEIEAAPQTEREVILAQHAAAIAAQPEKLRPRCTPALPVPTGKAEIEEWTRVTQRIYLLYIVGALQRTQHREANLQNVRYVLTKLNGMGGQW